MQSITDGDPNVLIGTRYRILGTIGSGAMGTVYEAQHVDLLRRVALKVLSQDRAMITDVAAFRREAQAIASVAHPNLVMIHDFGESADGRPYCAMELLDGETLEQRLIHEVRLQWREAVNIGILACRGLAAAHAVGVVHCDLKPANLFVTKGAAGDSALSGHHVGELKILDFGIARMASEVHKPVDGDGEVAINGTPEYMAPEQGRSGVIDARADVYALGCVLYELCTGRRPFVAGSAVALLEMKSKDAPEPMRVRSRALGLPALLDRVVLKALAPNPRDRHGSAEELRQDLEQVLAAPRRRRVASKFVGYVGIAGAGLFALGALGVLEWPPRQGGFRPREVLVSGVTQRALGVATELTGRAMRLIAVTADRAAEAWQPSVSEVVDLDLSPSAVTRDEKDGMQAVQAEPIAAATEHEGAAVVSTPSPTSTIARIRGTETAPKPSDHGTHQAADAIALVAITGNAAHANAGRVALGAGSAAPMTSAAPRVRVEIAALPSTLAGSGDPVATGLSAGSDALKDGFSSQALLIHRDLAQRNPRDVRVLRAWAESAAAAQEWKEAVQAAETWSLVESTVEPRLFYARMLGYGGKPRAARRMLEDILEAHPGCDEARALLADYRGGASGASKPASARAEQSQVTESIDEVVHRP
ncbi:MAG TPA: serine/threonine-protein kinase [Polyangiaceae bacterium]|nr:serine/threonine-protein kinase [Polyangiaceae bacterium]